MDLRRFRYFVVCAEELHFTRAARRIGIAQPPLSQQIQLLEKEVGTRLFHRLTRGVELTPAGEAFLTDARNVLDMAERAMTSARQIGRGERGSIKIGFTSSASFNPFVPGTISRFRAENPDVEVVLDENTTRVSLQNLRNGKLDIAFLRPAPGEVHDLRVQHLFHEEMRIALPASHPLANETRLKLSMLATDPFVLYPRTNGQALYDAIVAGCQNAGFSPRIVQEAPQMASTVSLVAAGVGVTLVPESMCQLQSSGVVYREIVGAKPTAALSLVQRERPPSVLTGKFSDLCRKLAIG
ncbi:LysR family transcriptional regulator [Xinfangfangia sp. D13-10-4-6]|uniref:LysR family transcriptional regulator n=1 Tax=Pseudogemmobacter hezensis TaxID=2737662 RepID=UPI0015518A9F|nr:LysR family transcriptional regulator [Pseudogemmobacter hezensis]NPD16111.1 LysR family transcriptional regulator [Pseudogemmobacter hezensis]